MSRARIFVFLAATLYHVDLSHSFQSRFVKSRTPRIFQRLNGAEKHSNDAKEQVVQKQAISKGSICEFEEKKRVHVGRVTTSEHKSNGDVRYTVEDPEGNSFSVSAKQIHFAVPSEGKSEKVLKEFDVALKQSNAELQKVLDIDPEVLELSWESAVEDDANHVVTAKSFIDLVHSRAPSSGLETYRAWRLLCSDIAHIFFKALKEDGRVVSFKAKAASAVEAAKMTFCNKEENDKEEFCFV